MLTMPLLKQKLSFGDVYFLMNKDEQDKRNFIKQTFYETLLSKLKK